MNSLEEAIEAIEGGYEFLLAYAAQGFEANQSGQHATDARNRLTGMKAALDALDRLAKASVGSDAAYDSFLSTLRADAERAAGIVSVVLGADGISSQLIDNFNASSHIRTVLTDLFLLDEALAQKAQS